MIPNIVETHTSTSICNILIVYVYSLPYVTLYLHRYFKGICEYLNGMKQSMGTERSDIYEKCSALIAEINIFKMCIIFFQSVLTHTILFGFVYNSFNGYNYKLNNGIIFI